MKYLYSLIAFMAFATTAISQAPSIQWEKSYGGTNQDLGYSIQQTTDGGYITVGTSNSTDGDISQNLGDYDVWVIKIDNTGNIEWQKSYGGTSFDKAYSVQQTSDGGYIIAAESSSNDGDVTGHHGTTGNFDYWILKLDNVGNIQWQKSYGGTSSEGAYSIQQTSDGGYVVAGYSFSNDGDVTGHHGATTDEDFWVIKIDGNGIIQWKKSLGGSYRDRAYSVKQTSDGGYIVTGYVTSFDGDVTGLHMSQGNYEDYWVVKLNNLGSITWKKCLGGSYQDIANDIIQTSEGGYIVSGFSSSNDGNVSGHHGLTGEYDYWIAKIDNTGNIEWQKSLGGTNRDGNYYLALQNSHSIQQTSDLGYVISGSSYSDDGDVTGHHGTTSNSDFWIVKINSIGNIQWQKSLGATNNEVCGSVKQTSGNEFIVVGSSYLGQDGDVSENNGEYDYWVVKLSADNVSSEIDVSGNLSFGSIPVNQTAQLSYIINNTGSNSLTVSSITYPTGFTGNWSSGIIAAGNSQTVTVTFAPTAVQSYAGVVTVNSDAISGTNTLAISGNGILGVGLSVSGNLDFGTVPQGSTDDMAVFLYNNTSSPIHINTITPSPTGVFNALMLNGSTVLPYQSLPVSIFFFPPALSTYNTTFTVTSDAPNGDITFTATGIGGNDPVSWIGIYNEQANNPEITSLETLEEHYISVTTVNPIKICADGSKATIVKYINNDVSVTTSDIVFNMQSDPLGNNTDYSGWFVTPDYTYNGNTVTAKFTHPKYLDISGLYRTDAIQVVNSSNSNVLYQHPVRIYRAPVVLVHGLWGATTSMLPVVDELLNSGKYNAALLQIADYSNSNSVSFNANSNVIKNNINSALIGLRILNYSAGKVDIVAHSMGGILSRIYLQNNDCGGGLFTNCYRGDIHKLITLNTPHSGTQVANFIFSNALGSGLAQTILNFNDMPWNNGAVYDLQCNSPAINSLNGSSLNNHIVTCHAIQTDRTPATTYLSFDEEALVNIIANARLQSVGAFVDEVFAYTPTDLIVPTNSQNGGLNDFSYIQDVKHTASPSDLSVIAKVQTLLDANPATSVYFDQNGSGYNPPQILPTFKTDETDVEHSVQGGGTVTITNPSLGFVCTEGDVLQIDVSASVNVDHLIITAGNINSGVTSFDTLANSASVYYTVPENIVGTVKIMAIGYDNNGFVDLDTLEIVANPDAILDSLAFVNDYINIPLGQSVPFTLNGYYSDSTIRNLNVVSNIPYDIDDTNVASLSTGHILNGLSVGTTFLHAAYQGKNAYITVNVYTGDDWVITALENEGTEISNEYSQLVVYPNPSKESVFFINKSKMQSNYELYGIMGNLLLSSNATQGVNEINIEGLANGIYYLQLNDGKKIYSARFVKQ